MYSKTVKQMEEELRQAKLNEKEEKKNKVSKILKTFKDNPEWNGLFCKDMLSAKIIYGKSPPYEKICDIKRSAGTEVIESDINYIRAYIEDTMNMGYSENEMWSIVKTIAERNCFNPLVEHLDSLVWDGERRLDTVLFDYAGVVPRDVGHMDLLTKLWRTWTTGLAMRAYKPGCKFDNMFVLDGKQYLGKSAFWRILAGSFFCDTPIDLSSKDAYINIQGVWLYELAEMETITKADANRQKNFLSSCTDKFRPPYARTGVDVPRSTVFCGTTNETVYLLDNTGSRRFYTATTESYVRQEEFAKVRDLVVAEMVHNYKNGVQTWLLPADHELHTAENLRKTPKDWYAPPIEAWLGQRHEDFIISDLFDHIKIPPNNRSRAFGLRIDSILRQMGWYMQSDGTYSKHKPIDEMSYNDRVKHMENIIGEWKDIGK